MPQHEVHLQEQVAAAPERVFEFVSDHGNFASLFGGSCTRIRVGDDPAEPNGVGSVRRIGPGPLSFDETILVFERPTRIDYTISRGGPLRNHIGTMRLRGTSDGTEIDYVIRFDGRFPGFGVMAARALAWGWKTHAPQRLATIGR